MNIMRLPTQGFWMIAAASGFVRLAAADVPKDSPAAPALNKAEAAVQAIVARPDAQRTFANTIVAIDDFLTQIDTQTGMLRFMQYVSTDAKQREDSAKAEEDVQNWLTDLGQREDLYKVVKAFADRKEKLAPLDQRLLDRLLRDYRRAGMDLPPDKRDQLKAIQKEITRLGLEFEKNIRDDETRVPMTQEELAGLPEDVLKAQPRAGELYLVGMDYPTFNGVMESCTIETTREKVWIAYKRRGGHKNVNLLEKILALRAQAASLLGYASAADYEEEVRMSKTAQAVQDFYKKLRPIVRKKAQADFNEYQDAKRADTKAPAAILRPWDQPYYEQYLLRTRYAVDSEKVKEYFPMQAVIDGLFSITQSLYGLEYRDITSQAAASQRPLWHPEVKLYEVWDKAAGKKLGEFYFDMYPRENKYTHAACWGLVPRKKLPDGSIQLPVAALVCNFPKPGADKPSLLPHDDVATFFHEFGHCLHNILTQVDYGIFAGSAVSRDFVEAPSQMFENWVWDADVLKTFARNYKTNDPLPGDLLDGMLKARYLGKGLWAEHQIYYGMTDLTYHLAPGGKVDTSKVAEDLFGQTELFKPVPGVYFQAAFGHLIGYQAGYYGYMWSLVYASDMFQRFKQLGMLDPKAGAYYRDKILSRGDTLDALDLVKDYLGREPSIDALLAYLGVSPN